MFKFTQRDTFNTIQHDNNCGDVSPAHLLAGPLCGDTAPEGFTVPGDHAFVTFYTDDSETSAGFSLAWSAN